MNRVPNLFLPPFSPISTAHTVTAVPSKPTVSIHPPTPCTTPTAMPRKNSKIEKTRAPVETTTSSDKEFEEFKEGHRRYHYPPPRGEDFEAEVKVGQRHYHRHHHHRHPHDEEFEGREGRPHPHPHYDRKGPDETRTDTSTTSGVTGAVVMLIAHQPHSCS
ncbi:hypothetical protein F5878DRAFT_667971 [Lentinula raphanica]|uniref:Uncharacterized protein n=1 Tax=Lentinula raphanica TaxID=153919 RepID=A0AA38NUX0_9AGAR|nr:hypothetical protein F5878DRAFT_667971 [Lentinula raphanica]